MITSERILPYVYMCTHELTGEFYIGFRANNKVPSHLDLPMYKTSSKFVRPRFYEFSWMIIAEFFDSKDAYEFEQSTILAHIGNPLLLNRFANGKFYMVGKKFTEDHKQKLSISNTGKIKGPLSVESRLHRSKIRIGLKFSATTTRKMSIAAKNRVKNKSTCPHCGKVGGNRNMTRWHFNNCKLNPNNTNEQQTIYP